jgi:hypothetical protein
MISEACHMAALLGPLTGVLMEDCDLVSNLSIKTCLDIRASQIKFRIKNPQRTYEPPVYRQALG